MRLYAESITGMIEFYDGFFEIATPEKDQKNLADLFKRVIIAAVFPLWYESA